MGIVVVVVMPFAIISKNLMYDVNIHIFSFDYMYRCNIMFHNRSNILGAMQNGKHSLVQYMIY